MPELPEVETVRRLIEPKLLRATVGEVELLRNDIVRTGCVSRSGLELLRGDRIMSVERRGKQLAIFGRSGRVLVVQLGMSGQFFLLAPGDPLPADHVHCHWTLLAGKRTHRLIFRDPRRFGGLSCFASRAELERAKWCELGPDALTIQGLELAERLSHTRRGLKTTLLDQSVLAGVGNIYADEALFLARLHPGKQAHRVSTEEAHRLAEAIRAVLEQSVRARGSTLRDYRDGLGEPGGNQHLLKVYGRGGEPCAECGRSLQSRTMSQRTTVYCAQCQRLR